MSENDSMKLFRNRLNALRAERAVSQMELANVCGVSVAAVSSWCVGKNIPRIDKVQKLAEYFDVPLSYFLDEKKPTPEIQGEPLEGLDKELMSYVRQLTPENKQKLIEQLEFLLRFQDPPSDLHE